MRRPRKEALLWGNSLGTGLNSEPGAQASDQTDSLRSQAAPHLHRQLTNSTQEMKGRLTVQKH